MAPGPHVLIVEARFYEDIADQLVKGASQVLDRAGVSYDRIGVPGVFEVPGAIRFALRGTEAGPSRRVYSGFVALGCVIKGETDHYDHICREASRAIMDISMLHCAAVGFGILTCPSYELAWVRAAVDQKNKGADAAGACLRMMELRQQFGLVAP